MFKNLEDLNPDYMAVSFDLKAKTERHKMYEGYKANRHGMPEELASQTGRATKKLSLSSPLSRPSK